MNPVVFSRAIGVTLFVIILLRQDFGKLGIILRSINIWLLLVALFLLIPLLLLKAWRWQNLMRIQGIKHSLKDTFLMYNAGVYVGILTPGRVGDIIKIFYLKNDGHSTGRSLVSVLFDRIFDLFFLGTLGFFGILFFVPIFNLKVALVLLTLIIFGILWKNVKLEFFCRRFVPLRYKEKLEVNINEFRKDVKLFNKTNLFWPMIATILGWAIYFVQGYILALSIGLNIDFVLLVIFISIATVVALLPVSISGIGTRDAALIVLFSTVGLGSEPAVIFSNLILFMSVGAATMGFFSWIKRPIEFKNI